MVLRMASLAILALILAGWTPAGNSTFPVAQFVESGDKAMDAAQVAEKDMLVGRYYTGKRNYPAAINHFNTVITQYPTSPDVEEALARLAEIYLVIGITSEAQCAAAVLQRKFPDGHWSHQALDMLKSNNLDPAGTEISYNCRAFQ